MRKFKSLSERLLVWQIAASVVMLTLLFGVVYLFLSLSLKQKQEGVLQQTAKIANHLVLEADMVGSTDELIHKLDDFLIANGGLGVTLRQSNGTHLYQKQQTTYPAFSQKSNQFVVPTLNWGVVAVNLSLDIRTDQELQGKFAWLLFLTAFAGSILVASIGYAISRSGLKPLQLLTQQIQTISASDLKARLDGSAQPQEIQAVVVFFNALLDRLKLSFEQMEFFNANVAHELKNPIATLITSHEVELLSKVSNDRMSNFMVSNLEELKRISSIVNDMLFLSRADQGIQARTQNFEELAILAIAVAEYYEVSAETASLQVVVKGNASGNVDGGLIKRALSNLLSNAIRHADVNSTIEIIVRDCGILGNKVRVSVVNNGEPVSQKYLSKIFERFFRADSARSNSKDHHGLGLAIVGAVAKMHGGETFSVCDGRRVEIGFEISK